MNKSSLNDVTKEKIDELVGRVAKKAGYTAKDIEGFVESLGAEIDEAGRRFEGKCSHRKHHHHRRHHHPHRRHHHHGHHHHKHFHGGGHFGMGKSFSRRDFAEEIRTYIADGIRDLMAEGHSEEEALKITLAKFDEAESKDDFKDFFADFDGFEVGQKIALWHVENGDTIGLFYAASVIFGITVGALLGYLLGEDLVQVGIGAGFGLFFGISGGLLSHAILTATRSLFGR